MSEVNGATKHAVNWPLIAAAYATLFCLGILDNIRGPFFPDIIRDLNLTNSQAALFYAVASGMMFVTGSIVAQSSRRFGDLVVVRLGQVTMAIGFAVLSMVQNFWQMVGACMVFGLGFGVLNVAQNLLIIDGSSGPVRRRLLSGLHAMYAFSSILAPLVAAQIFRSGGTWRQGFFYAAVFVIASFLVSFWPKSNKHSADQLSVRATPFPRAKMWLVATFLSFYVVAELTITTRMALYLRSDFNYTPEGAAEELAKLFGCMLLGRLVFLIFKFKWSTQRIVAIALSSTLVFLLLGLFVNAHFLFLVGLGLAPVFGLSVDYVAHLFSEDPGRAVNNAIAISCLFIVGMHVLFGVLSDYIGVGRAFLCAPIFTILSLVFLGLTRRYDQTSYDSDQASTVRQP